MDALNYSLAAAVLGTVSFLIFLPGLIVRLGKADTTRPRRESMSERHDRLDAEAARWAEQRAAANVEGFERLGRSANR